jgi:phosphate transport system substrate-binding protein
MKKLVFVALAALMIAGCKPSGKGNENSGKGIEMSGAGATFPLPYYNIIFKDYSAKTFNQVTYGGIGSGGGIRSLQDKTVDFGASDAYLSEDEKKEMQAAVLHIPTCMGAVVLAYNLSGVEKLQLNGEVISDIFLGKITKWNDGKIKALNPGMNLPDKAVTPVYRSDGSGTTYVFTDYLTKVSPEWAEKMGTGKSLKWPAGIAAKGNPGVSGTIQQTEGTIGYIGSEYSLSLNIPTAVVQNSAGNFIEASTRTISAAANIELPADMCTMITNSPEAEAYPISCFTWIIVYQEQAYANRTIEQANALVNLLDYVLSPDAQSVAEKVHYSPLPEAALKNAQALVKSMTYNGKEIAIQ